MNNLGAMTRKNVYEIPECELLELKLEDGFLGVGASAEPVSVQNADWDND